MGIFASIANSIVCKHSKIVWVGLSTHGYLFANISEIKIDCVYGAHRFLTGYPAKLKLNLFRVLKHPTAGLSRSFATGLRARSGNDEREVIRPKYLRRPQRHPCRLWSPFEVVHQYTAWGVQLQMRPAASSGRSSPPALRGGRGFPSRNFCLVAKAVGCAE